MKRLLSIILLSFTSSSAWCLEIQRNFDSTVNLGRGNTGTADTYGLDAFFYNPAFLGDSGRTVEELSIISPQMEASDEVIDIYENQKNYNNLKIKSNDDIAKFLNKKLHLNVQNFTGASLKKIAFGIVNQGRLHFESEVNLLNPESYVYAETVLRNGVMFGVGHEVYENLRLGLTLKVLNKVEHHMDLDAITLAEHFATKDTKLKDLLISGTGTGAGVDFGALWSFPVNFVNVRLGLSVFNIGDLNYKGGGTAVKPRKDPQVITVGSALETTIDRQTFTQTFDFVDLAMKQGQSIYNHIHVGLRWAYQNYFGAQVGINQGYATAGVFLRYKIVSFEYARYGVELGEKPGLSPDLRHAAQIQLGWNL
jgi:hypothetical protein